MILLEIPGLRGQPVAPLETGMSPRSTTAKSIAGEDLTAAEVLLIPLISTTSPWILGPQVPLAAQPVKTRVPLSTTEKCTFGVDTLQVLHKIFLTSMMSRLAPGLPVPPAAPLA